MGFGQLANKSIDRLRTATIKQTELPSTPTKKANPYHFVKLHAPWHVLCTYAEELHMYAPIIVSNFLYKHSNYTASYSGNELSYQTI